MTIFVEIMTKDGIYIWNHRHSLLSIYFF